MSQWFNRVSNILLLGSFPPADRGMDLDGNARSVERPKIGWVKLDELENI